VSNLKETLADGTACVHDTLRDAFTIELSKLLNEVVVLQQDGTTGAKSQRVVVVENGSTLVGGPERGIVGARRAVLHRR